MHDNSQAFMKKDRLIFPHQTHGLDGIGIIFHNQENVKLYIVVIGKVTVTCYQRTSDFKCFPGQNIRKEG